MSRAWITIRNDADRAKACQWVAKAPVGYHLEFKEPKRSTAQNARMWAMLSEVAAQLPWHGVKLSPDDWKLIFLDGLKRELRIVPNMEGTGFVNLGRSSDLSVREMTDLIELIAAFGANHGVKFQDERRAA